MHPKRPIHAGITLLEGDNNNALQKLEAMKIPTGVPMVVQYQQTNIPGRYRALPVVPAQQSEASLQYLSSSILPSDD